MPRPFHVLVLLFEGYFAHMNGLPPSRATHPIYLTYSKLCQDILNRPVAVSRIPPCLETGFQERYVLDLANLIVNIHKLDEINQAMTLQLYFGLTWYHSELSWNPSDYDNISFIYVHSSNIWTPKIEVNMGNEDSSTLDLTGDLSINSDGGVTFMKLGFLSFACKIDFYHYPFDSQTCSFGFYPHGPPYADPKFTLNNFSLSKIYNLSMEWSFESHKEYIIEFYEWGNGVVKVPTCSLTVRRKSLYYVMNIIFPMVLTSVMIPMVFVIPTQTGEKVSYLVALFTSTAIFLNFISDVMPRSLSSIPYLAMLLIEVLVEGLLAMMASLLVVNIHVREEMETGKEKEIQNCSADGNFTQKAKTSSTISDVAIKSVSIQTSGIPRSKKLDRIFFLLFTFGQIIFLVILFLGTDWIIQSNKGHS